MQLTRPLVAFLLLAACGDDTKLALQVVAPAGSDITTVELWLAGGDCGDCMGGIGAPGAKTRPLGPVHLVAGATAFTAPVVDGIATFGIGKGDGGEVLVDQLAAVGYSADGTPEALVVDDTGFDITAQLGEIRRYELVKTDITGELKEDASDAAVLWRAGSGDTGCLMVTQGGSTQFFVPDGDDRDCDGITGAQECDADWFKYEAPRTNQVCTDQDPDLHACVIGYQVPCQDGATRGGCSPEVCGAMELCGDPQCTTNPGACLVSHAETLPHLDCVVPILTANSVPQVCQQAGATFQFDGIDKCDAQGFIQSLQFPPQVQSALEFSDGGLPNGQVTITNAGDGPCHMAFKAELLANVTPDTQSELHGALALRNGGSPIAIVPIYVRFVNQPGDCQMSGPSARITCTVDNYTADAFGQCLH